MTTPPLHPSQSHRLRLYQSGPSLEIVKGRNDADVLSPRKLESAIVAHKSVDKDNDDGPSIFSPTYMDPLLLECDIDRLPAELSLLGFNKAMDDDDGAAASQPQDGMPLQVVTYQYKKNSQDETKECICDNVSQAYNGVHPWASSSSSSEARTTLFATWIDVRRAPFKMDTQAAAAHWIRCLLGNSHAASPWATQKDTNHIVLSDVVVVVCEPLGVTSPLLCVRVGDVSPSFYHRAVVRVRIPVNSVTWWKTTTNGSSMDTQQEELMESATVLVYRIMPHRERIHDELPPPSSSSCSSLDDAVQEARRRYPNCLWEAFIKQDQLQDHDDGDDDGNTDDAIVAYRPLAPPYLSHIEAYPGLLEPLLQHLEILRQEAEAIPAWTAWPERQHYASSSSDGDPDKPTWTVFPLCHCFPADQVDRRKWIEVTCAHVPRTVQLLRQHLGDTLRTALFSRLAPTTVLNAHTGWQDLANHVVRVHIPLLVPPGELCGTWVDGCVETHKYGEPLCFDDSKVHRAFNYSDQERVVLILDLARPEDVPPGYAIGGHSDELDAFIDQLT